MATNQEGRHLAAFTASGASTISDYNRDFMRMFDADGIPAGAFNERFLGWINGQLLSSHTSLRDAQAAYAASKGANKWDEVASL